MEIYEFKGINKDEAIKKAENELGIDQEAYCWNINWKYT